MNESKLKKALVQILRKKMSGAQIFCHEDQLTHGIPDISITWKMRIAWFEVKHVNPDFYSSGIQLVTCLNLAGAANCYYIIYDEPRQRTLITHPIAIRTSNWQDARAQRQGFDHDFVAQFAIGLFP